MPTSQLHKQWLPEYLLLIKVSVVLSCLNIGCNDLNKLGFLNGRFGTSAEVAPNIRYPETGATVVGISENKVNLAWSEISGAVYYTVEVATDQAFDNQVDGSPFRIKSQNGEPPETDIAISVTEAVTHYWRVRARTAKTSNWSSADDSTHPDGYPTFEAFDDSVYVYCPSAIECEDNAEVGNLEEPVITIERGMQLAQELGLYVKVASRGGGSAYENRLQLYEGAQVRGGYQYPDFLEDDRHIPPNTGANFTMVLQEDAQVVSANSIGHSDQETHLQGFYIKGGVLTDYNTMQIIGSGSNLFVHDNLIIGGINTDEQSLNLKTVVYISDSDPTFYNNTIYSEAQSGAGHSGIFLSYSQGIFYNNKILSARNSTGEGAGINFYQSSSIVYNNLITGPSTQGDTSSGMRFRANSFGFVFLQNIMAGGPSNTNSAGIGEDEEIADGVIMLNQFLAGPANGISFSGFSGGFSGKYLQNNFVAGLSTSGSYSYVADGATPHFEGNLMTSLASSGTIVGFLENDSLDPTNMDNNIWSNGTFYIDDDVGPFDSICTGGTIGTNTCTGVDLLTTPANSGNVEIVSPLVSQAYAYLVIADGPDANATFDGDLSSLEVADCEYAQLVVGEYIDIAEDGIAREVTAFDCDSVNSTIDFTPALDEAPKEFTPVRLWGSNNSDYGQNGQPTETTIDAVTIGCDAHVLESMLLYTDGDADDCERYFSRYNYSYNNTSDECTVQYVSFAAEIFFDGIGNDNGLCESDEECVRTTHAGYNALDLTTKANLTQVDCGLSLSGVVLYE